nr:metallophosphoesterase [candidate division Zixibacteria bacterium]
MNCFFVSDLHGKIGLYRKLFDIIQRDCPEALFLGGDLLPSGLNQLAEDDIQPDNFILDFIRPQLTRLKTNLSDKFPRIFVILGNDDSRLEETAVMDIENESLWEYIHGKKTALDRFPVYGYAHIPPSPFLLKDWEKYDVSRHVDPGSLSPEAGYRTIPREIQKIRYSTIARDLADLTGDFRLDHSIFLFHSPPYRTRLDRADLDGRMFEHVPLDVHIGSIAVQRFISERQPLLTLHGHVHESSRLTGTWSDRIGKTVCLSAAYDGPELALVRFDPDCPEKAVRELL